MNYTYAGRWLAAGVVSVVLFGLFIAGCWQAHWWLFSQTVNRTAKIQSQSYGAQTGDSQQISSDWASMAADISDAERNPQYANSDKTEYLAAGNDLCQVYAKITGTVQISQDVNNWAKQNCSGDAVSPSSPYRKGIVSNP